MKSQERITEKYIAAEGFIFAFILRFLYSLCGKQSDSKEK